MMKGAWSISLCCAPHEGLLRCRDRCDERNLSDTTRVGANCPAPLSAYSPDGSCLPCDQPRVPQSVFTTWRE